MSQSAGGPWVGMDAAERETRPAPAGRTQADTAARAGEDMAAFQERHKLDRVVVVNVATTEPAAAHRRAVADIDALRAALRGTEAVLPASSLYVLCGLH